MSPLSSTASQSALSELSRQHLELRDQYDEQRKAYDAFRDQQVDVENEVARKQRVRREFDVQEIELHHAQNMEAIGQLSGGIAHDFNNHLTVILGYTEILLQTVFDTASREYVEKIRDSAFASASLSKQLLTFARHQVLKPKILDLNEFLDATQAVLRRAVGDTIVIGFERGPNVGSVSLDRKQFEQVLLNLAINAREAIGQSRGRLMIETASVYLDGGYADTHPGVTPGDHVMLSVSDNGPGMAPEILARIFEPFFTTKETGTGLGLSMVRGIVAQSGGTINVSSEAESGTSFRIYLPRVATDERDAEPEQIRAEAVGDEHVLVIEDEVRFGDIVAATLARHGYKVTVARNGNDALAKVAESLPDLVLSDIVMSGMNGVETVEKLHDQFGDVPAIYMSGYTENAILRRGVQPNDLVLLQKPFTHRELLSAIRVVLDDV